MKTDEKKTRTESDLLGSVEVPEEVLYGVQTMRGLENFAISKFHLCDYPRFIEGLAVVKLGAAMANHEMGLLSDERGQVPRVLPRGHDSGRRRHDDEHERQRGDCQPCAGDYGSPPR